MGRNKYPEQTLERIIDTSTRLFIEKGYEQTSIQDILDALNLSKGGLYHHFKSKEDILNAVIKKRAEKVTEMLHEIIQTIDGVNAKEKLKKILKYLITDSETHTLDRVLNTQANNPYFVVNRLQDCIKKDAPIFRTLIENGIEDGSLQTEQPELCAEVFILLLNYWISPVLFNRTLAETKERLEYFRSLMSLLKFDVIDSEFIESVMDGYKNMGVFQS